jgi:hypothetical protein
MTRLITSRMAELCGVGQLRNVSIFASMLIINYLLLAFWLPITGFIKDTMFVVGSEVPPHDLSGLKSFIVLWVNFVSRNIFGSAENVLWE